MPYLKTEAGASITALSPVDLLAAWDLYGHLGLVETFRCEVPLSEFERALLPEELLDRLVEEITPVRPVEERTAENSVLLGATDMNGDIEYRHECPECQEAYFGDDRWNFCPVCGARLKVFARMIPTSLEIEAESDPAEVWTVCGE